MIVTIPEYEEKVLRLLSDELGIVLPRLALIQCLNLSDRERAVPLIRRIIDKNSTSNDFKGTLYLLFHDPGLFRYLELLHAWHENARGYPPYALETLELAIINNTLPADRDKTRDRFLSDLEYLQGSGFYYLLRDKRVRTVDLLRKAFAEGRVPQVLQNLGRRKYTKLMEALAVEK